VRTILDQQDDVDRTTIKQLQRIDPDPARERVWQARRADAASATAQDRRGGEGAR
jgi:hypothetical protein